MAKYKQLYRSTKNKVLGGVCGGLGEYYSIDPVIIRILWILFSLAWGAGIIAYILALIIVPKNPGK